MGTYKNPVPDNPDGSGDTVYTFTGMEGEEYEIPQHYEHLGPDSEWEVVTVIPYAGETPEHLNTYRVPGTILGSFLLEVGDPSVAEMVVSVRRI